MRFKIVGGALKGICWHTIIHQLIHLKLKLWRLWNAFEKLGYGWAERCKEDVTLNSFRLKIENKSNNRSLQLYCPHTLPAKW